MKIAIAFQQYVYTIKDMYILIYLRADILLGHKSEVSFTNKQKYFFYYKFESGVQTYIRQIIN